MTCNYFFNRRVIIFVGSLLLTACASQAPIEASRSEQAGKTICDSYVVFEMCVRDLVSDGTVDMVYFSDTDEIFMYREGMRDTVASVMPLHRCAVPLNPGMQATTNRILGRSDMSISEEVEVARDLLRNYLAAKPLIDACNEKYAEQDAVDVEPEEEFFLGDWEESDF